MENILEEHTDLTIKNSQKEKAKTLGLKLMDYGLFQLDEITYLHIFRYKGETNNKVMKFLKEHNELMVPGHIIWLDTIIHSIMESEA